MVVECCILSLFFIVVTVSSYFCGSAYHIIDSFFIFYDSSTIALEHTSVTKDPFIQGFGYASRVSSWQDMLKLSLDILPSESSSVCFYLLLLLKIFGYIPSISLIEVHTSKLLKVSPYTFWQAAASKMSEQLATSIEASMASTCKLLGLRVRKKRRVWKFLVR